MFSHSKTEFSLIDVYFHEFIAFCLVVAADGFTYERAAITKWLNKSNCSPMTNELLANKNLQENKTIAAILKVLLSRLHSK